MPRELHDAEQFQNLMSKALELRVVRVKDIVKLKLRTPEYLYTLKTNEDEANDIIKKAKDLEIIEISQKKEEKEEKSEAKKSD